MLDPLGANDLPSGDKVKKVVRAILERKYGLLGADYVQMVVDSITDDPIRLREPRYIKSRRALKGEVRAASEPRIALVLNDDHTIHHVQDRGYVEAPVRIRSIMAELDPSGLFEKMPAKRYSDRHIRAVHDGRLVDYIRKACLMAGPKKSIYPYVFPTRNPARAPRDETVLAGYYCIDTFTPLNQNAYLAARSAVDCALDRGRAGAGGAPNSPMPWCGRPATTPRRAPSAASATSTMRRSPPTCCRATAGSRSSTSTITTATASRRSSTTRADVLTVSIHGHPSFAYPYFTGFRDETGIGPGAGLQSQHPAAGAHHPGAASQRGGRGLAAHQAVSPGLSRGLARLRHRARRSHRQLVRTARKDFEQLGRMIGEQGYSTLVVQEGGYRVRTLGANARNFFVGLVTGHSAARQMAPIAEPKRWRQSPTIATGSNGGAR